MAIRGPVQLLFSIFLLVLGGMVGASSGNLLFGALAVLAAGTAAGYFAFAVFLFAASRYRHSEVPPPLQLGPAQALALFIREWWAIALLYGYYHIPVLTRRPAGKWKAGGTGTAIVFVHGFCCNGGFWQPLVARAGAQLPHSIYTITLNPLWATIDRSADQLAALLDRVTEEGHTRIILVGHSMGGLVSRCCYQRYANREIIARIITLGTPHHGTWEACLNQWPNSKQMRPGNPWLEALNTNPIQHPALTSIYSLHDSVITPQRSSKLEGAVNVELGGIGHMEMSRHPTMIEEVLRALEAVGPSA